jgi:hypothetical protein
MSDTVDRWVKNLKDKDRETMEALFPQSDDFLGFLKDNQNIQSRSQLGLLRSWHELTLKWPHPHSATHDPFFWELFFTVKQELCMSLVSPERSLMRNQMENVSFMLMNHLYPDLQHLVFTV